VSARPSFELLETRWVPSSFTVKNLNDSGPDSLRQAILDANSMGGDNTITFTPGVTGTIALASPLPNITSNIDLEGPGPASLTVTVENSNPPVYIGNLFSVMNGAVVTIAGLTIAGANNDGIYTQATGTLTIRNCILANNGIGIFAFYYENLNVSNCTLGNNHSTGIYYSSSAVGQGGVLTVNACTIANDGNGIANDGTINISNSTISNNTLGGIVTGGTMTLTNCTIASNSVRGNGGGIQNGGTLTLLNSTVAGNVAEGHYVRNGLIYIYVPGNGSGIHNTGTVTVQNTIIAGNTPPDSGGVGPDVNGAFVSQGYNLVGDGSGGSGFTAPGDRVGSAAAPINPLLGLLQDNGGPTPTMAILPGSPAINAATPVGAPAADQRGVPRVPRPLIDIGAFEYQGTSDPNQAYVASLYSSVLNRAPDPAGLQAWVQALDAGTVSYAQVAAGFWGSVEHWGLVVDELYLTLLHRAADPSGRAAWTNALLMGAVSEAQASVLFVTSPEYTGSHLNNQSYVIGLYNDVLGRNRAITSAEVALWQGQLDSRALSRAAVASLFVNSEEDILKGIAADYLTLLGRSASPAELQVWWQAIAAGQVDPDLIPVVMLCSPEYVQKA
jgi:hypothetical protein